MLIQAMACGCPVVSTDCPTGPREILEDGRYAPLVKVRDHAGMAEAIARMLDTPTPAAEPRARASQFSVDAAVEAYLTLFRDLGSTSCCHGTGSHHSELPPLSEPPPSTPHRRVRHWTRTIMTPTRRSPHIGPK